MLDECKLFRQVANHEQIHFNVYICLHLEESIQNVSKSCIFGKETNLVMKEGLNIKYHNSHTPKTYPHLQGVRINLVELVKVAVNYCLIR
jgi:hypothetical protein